MNAPRIFAALAIAVICTPTLITADETEQGVVAGWDSSDGHVLLGELKCAACHDPGALSNHVSHKEAPNLSEAGSRITPQYLREFLSNPHTTNPGTTMPDVMHGLTDKQRTESVDALVHYLASRGDLIDQKSSGASLSEIARGRDLYHTVGCVACHQAFDAPPKHLIDEDLIEADDEDPSETAAQADDKPSVPLPPLAMKTTVDELAAFLHDPLKVRPSGRMPSLNLQAGEGRAIAAYLLREQYSEDEVAPGAGVAFAFYNGNFKSAKDLAEAPPDVEGQVAAVDLKDVFAALASEKKPTPKSNFGVRFHGLLEVPADGEYRFWVKSDDGTVVTINDKIVIDNDGHHPPKETEGAVQLRKGRHPIEIAFMQGGGGYEFSFAWQPPSAKQRQPLAGGVLLNNASAMIPVGIAEFQVDAAKAKKGRELFAKLRCASCHESGEEFADINSSMPLARLNSATRHGCASATPAGGLPKYDFNSQQIEALQTSLKSLQSKPKELDAAGHLHRTMTAMNCYACHQRGEVGGPSDAKSDYFVYERVVDLGDEGRLPPPLHEVGAKLTHQGFDDMLFSGQKYRTYMATRMPQFGKENIGHAVELFEKADAGKVPAREPEFSPRHVDDGRMLAGSKGLSCINCHAWGDLRLPGAEGMDLMQSSRRLKPAWFHAWLKDPQKMRPGTRMPSAWPQGQTFFKDIQGGEVDAQIDAVWAYLSVGQKAGPPPGLGSGDGKELTPTDEPIVFRTFVDQLGAHTILVGFRQRTHVAFDANLIRTRAAWTGSFITTAPVWDGRAGQYAKIPSSDIVRLPEGPAFAKLTSDAAAWPVDKPKAKIGSNRMPDGWRFKGYELDEDRIPTFLYAVGDVEVRETPGTEFLRDAAVVRRAFELSSAKAVEDFYFRAAQGEKIVADGDQFVADDNLRFRITSNGSSKPFVRTIEGRSELLVPIVLRQGKMNFSVEMKW